MAKTVVVWIVCTLASGIAILGGPALAQECKKPLTIVESLTLAPMSNEDLRLTIPVSINGKDEPFLFDTGGDLPQISQDLVDELQLSKYRSDTQLYGVSGKRSDYYTVVDFKLGKLVQAPKAAIMITDTNIITPVFMGRFDFDFDATNHKLNVLSGDHCRGQVIYWHYKAATSVPYIKRDNHISVPVTVDGKDFVAIIDTGATISIMRQDLAQHVFGLTPDSPGMQEAGHLGNDEKAVVYRYPFKTLTFGDITVNNPKIAILPDVVGKNADKTWGYFGGHITAAPDELKLPQIIIGMDVLTKLHVYFAQDEKKLYITDAGAPANPTP